MHVSLGKAALQIRVMAVSALSAVPPSRCFQVHYGRLPPPPDVIFVSMMARAGGGRENTRPESIATMGACRVWERDAGHSFRGAAARNGVIVAIA